MNFFTPYTYRDITNVTLADFSYTFAANENNIETMSIDHRPNQPYNAFSYDSLDRITDVVYLSNQNDVESFPMDDLGNRTGSVTQRDGVHNYSVNTLTNRYTTIDSISISYDAAGNLIQDKDGYHYVYDYENRVIRIFKLDGQTEVTVAQYAYDALGRRIWKYDPLATQPNVYYYYNDQWQILCEYTGTDSCLQWLTYGNYIDEVLSRNTSTTAMLVIQYYIQDHLYNVVGLANGGGTVVERYEYDVYGNPTIINRGTDQAWYTTDDITLTASAYNNLFNFTGRQLDVLDGGVLKYMHYRHRDYSPFMGRFIQYDPLGMNPSRFIRGGLALRKQYKYGTNLYEYIDSMPTYTYDPLGLQPACKDDNPCPLGERATCIAAAGPFDCLKAYEAQLLTQEILNGMPGPLPPGKVDGPQDALRHCIGTCLLTQSTDAGTAATIAAVHEVCSPNSSSGPMDNHNNMIGISIGKEPDADCGQACSDALSGGDLIVLPPDQWR